MENNRMPILCTPQVCTGCEACANICPSNAIKMIAERDGFLQPNINVNECVKCLACEKVCPVLNIKPIKNTVNPKVYACWNKDKDARAESSSGGAFSALAESVYALGGYVIGAIYDNNMSVKHYVTHSADELHRLRGSKYVQSKIGFVYRQIKDLLKSESIVLFVGTPCQVSGLRAYLRHDYDNLYCCDFICHGTPSPLLFKKYLDWVEKNKHIKITDFNFRHKCSGWYDATRFANKRFMLKGKFDAYFYGFNKDITLRESCYRCPSIGLPRKGDLTIADFWGIGMMYKFTEPNEIHKGISLLMTNNDKGQKLFELAKRQMNCVERRFDEALKRNQPMLRPSYRPQSRNTFYVDMETMSFEQLRLKYFQIKSKDRMVAWIRESVPSQFVICLRQMVQFITWKRNGSKTI